MFKVRKYFMNIYYPKSNVESNIKLRGLKFLLQHKKKQHFIKFKNALFFVTKLHSLKLLAVFKKVKKILNSKKFFINKSYSSMSLLNLEFKNSLMNKQKITLQTISTFPNIDLNISSNFEFYYAKKQGIYNPNSLKKINSRGLEVKFKNFYPIKKKKFSTNITKQMNNVKKVHAPAPQCSELIPQFNFKTNGISIPIFARKPINISPFVLSFSQPYGLNRTFNTTFSFFNYKNNLTFNLQKLNNSSFLSTFLEKYVFKLLSFQRKISKNLQIIKDKNSDFSNSEFVKSPSLPLLISSEIVKLLPIIFNCPYFSYNLIQKLDKTFMKNNNFHNLSSQVYKKNKFKFNFLSQKIEVKNLFFTSFENKFRSFDPLGKTSSYSPFKGELIYKKDLNSFVYTNKKVRFTSENLFPVYNQNSALILTSQDLVAFSLEYNTKKISRKKEIVHQTLSSENILFRDGEGSSNIQLKTDPLFEMKKKYYINDIIIKFQKMNQLSTSFKDNVSNVGEKNKHLKDIPLKISKNIIETVVKVNKLPAGLPLQVSQLYVGEFFMYGDILKNNLAVFNTGQIIHFNQEKVTLRKGQPIFVSPKAILHKYHGDLIDPQSSVITLSYAQLKTGDIIQGIPKVEQFFEARTTKRGRLFRDSLPNLLKALFKRYVFKLPFDKAVRQSFYKIQQIIVDGVQRVYRAQGVSIADKHLEIIVKQMTSKVRISFAGVTGFFPGEIVDLDLVEYVNLFVTKKVQYEPLVLGITKASLEVNSFLSAASFQQTSRVLSKAAISRKRDFLRGLKENVILGNLIPAGTGLLVYLEKKKTIESIVEDKKNLS